ncbi:MAG: htrA [Phycisphaerales bacterium]|nr:htrA [Phycisphaerales bacterium]
MNFPLRNAMLALSTMVVLCFAPASSKAQDAEPAPDKQQYIRRLTLDLTGVPPTEQEVRTFVEDRSPDCYKNLVKRLNASRTDALVLQKLDKVAVDNPSGMRLDVILLKRISTSYLGAGVEVPTATVRAQLRLPEGAGLVVNYVDAEGPSKGLVQEHDVLQKLDEQILVNGEQLVTLVRMHKPGETIALTLIREAKPIVVPIKLGEKQIDAVGNAGDANTTYSGGLIQAGNFLSGANGNITWADTVLDAAHGNGANPGDGSSMARALFAMGNAGNPGAAYQHVAATYQPLVVAQQNGPLTFDDGKTLVLYYLSPAGKPQMITVLDRASGKVLFSGPTGSEEQWKAVPEDVRQKIASWRDMLRQVNGTPDPATQPAEK